MKSKLQKSEKGFTIIEVLIVLAIAGLILLIVFLAVPALQRNSRNTQRKNDVQNVIGGVSEYVTNNNGALPADATALPIKTALYQSADIDYTKNTNQQAAIGTKVSGKLYVKTFAKCNTAGDDFAGTGASSRNIAALYEIEQSGSTVWKCQES